MSQRKARTFAVVEQTIVRNNHNQFGRDEYLDTRSSIEDEEHVHNYSVNFNCDML